MGKITEGKIVIKIIRRVRGKQVEWLRYVLRDTWSQWFRFETTLEDMPKVLNDSNVVPSALEFRVETIHGESYFSYEELLAWVKTKTKV